MKQNTGTIKGETKSGQDIKTWVTQTGQVITLKNLKWKILTKINYDLEDQMKLQDEIKYFIMLAAIIIT